MTCIPINLELLTLAHEHAGLDTLALAGVASVRRSLAQGGNL